MVFWELVSQTLGHTVVMEILGFCLMATVVLALLGSAWLALGFLVAVFGQSVGLVGPRRPNPWHSGPPGTLLSALMVSKPSRR